MSATAIPPKRRSKIGLNLIYLVPGHTGGMETYAKELIAEMTAQTSEFEFVAFINREADQGSWIKDAVATVAVPVNASSRLQWVRGEQQLLPKMAKAAGVDLVHSLASTAPLWGAFKRVVTINDLNYRVVPDTHSFTNRLGMRVLVPAAARHSDHIIAISRSTCDDLTTHLHVPRERISVVLDGAPQPANEAASEQEIRQQLALGEREILLTLSAKRPHKNLERLIRALALIPKAGRPLLVLPGYSTPYEQELKAVVGQLGLSDDVKFFSWLDAKVIEGLFAAAKGFIFPSLYEGFGLPVLEAMVRGVPVACSNRGSLAEVAGDAALLFNPESVEEIAASIERLLSDSQLCSDLVSRGYMQAAKFSWKQTATETLDVYRKVL